MTTSGMTLGETKSVEEKLQEEKIELTELLDRVNGKLKEETIGPSKPKSMTKEERTELLDKLTEKLTKDPLDIQFGGDHYKNKKIQPIEFIMANDMSYAEGCVVKYITRYKEKNGIEDLQKIKHYVDFIIKEMEDVENN